MQSFADSANWGVFYWIKRNKFHFSNTKYVETGFVKTNIHIERKKQLT